MKPVLLLSRYVSIPRSLSLSLLKMILMCMCVCSYMVLQQMPRRKLVSRVSV